MHCRSCGRQIKEFFSLGDMPLVNAFLKKSELRYENKYELAIGFCPQCYLVQLMKNIDPTVLFKKYLYFSSTSSSFLNHCKKTAIYLKKRFHLSKNSLVFEIASNDGAQLDAFRKIGIPVLGIDPAKNIVQIANDRGIPTISDFFNLKTAEKLNEKNEIEADIIFGANVLAHIPNINDFLKGVKTILKPDGTAVFESPYIKGLFDNKFDTIYHEHVFYYSALALCNIFDKAGLVVYDMDFTTMQGGSFRLFASHPGTHKKTSRLTTILRNEKKEDYDKFQSYKHIASRVKRSKKNLLTLLKQLKKNGNTIAAYGAPAKGVILLNYFGINSSIVDFIVDKATQKQNLFVPGVHLKVLSPQKILIGKPDYVLILCWNIADEVMKQLHSYKKQGGKFIIPIPKLRIK